MDPLWRGGCEKLVEACCRDSYSARSSFDWKENGRAYGLDCRANDAGRYLLCSATDAKGKRHKLFFPEGRGLFKGWSLLAKKIQGLGLRSMQEEKSMRSNIVKSLHGLEKAISNLGRNKGSSLGFSFAEVTRRDNNSKTESVVHVDINDRVPGEALGF